MKPRKQVSEVRLLGLGCEETGGRRGFTLLEMSIVLVIIATIVAGGMTIFSASLQKRQLQETQAKLKVIQKALLDYRIANNRLPCPADVTLPLTSLYFGYEAGSLVNSVWAPDAGSCITNGTYVNDALTGTAANSVAVDFARDGSGPGSASFVSSDTTTQGSWVGVYGGGGYDIEGDSSSSPAWASDSVSGGSTYTWANPTADVRGLQLAENHSNRIAAVWYSGTSFTINVTITDGNTHQVNLYAVDWDGFGGGRSETITVENALNNAVLDTRTISAGSAFQNGVYYTWNIAGNVNFVITNTNGSSNAVINGLFFAGSGGGSPPTWVQGMVPTQALHLPDDYALDGWGRRIMYTVDSRITANGAFLTILPTDTTTRMTVNDQSGNAKSTTAGYVLVSFGPNGHGAYPRNGAAIGSRISSGSNHPDELTNCDCNNTATSNTTIPGGVFVQEQPNQYAGHLEDPTYFFDDIVAYGTRSDLRSPTE